MKTEAVSKELATPNDLSEKGRKAIAAALNPLIADIFALYIKTKNYHWHLTGSHYRDYHLMFDEQADQVFGMIDVLAERVRKLGHLTIHSMEEIRHLQRIKDDSSDFVKPTDMLKRLLDDNKQIAQRMRDVHEICSTYHDVATTSLLETYIDETERRIWFLHATLSGG